MRHEIIEINHIVGGRCEKAVMDAWDEIDRTFPYGAYPVIRKSPGLASKAALESLETGDIIGVRADGKWLQIVAIDPLATTERPDDMSGRRE